MGVKSNYEIFLNYQGKIEIFHLGNKLYFELRFIVQIVMLEENIFICEHGQQDLLSFIRTGGRIRVLWHQLETRVKMVWNQKEKPTQVPGVSTLCS